MQRSYEIVIDEWRQQKRVNCNFNVENAIQKNKHTNKDMVRTNKNKVTVMIYKLASQ